MRPSARTARPHDPTVYPVQEKVGEYILQRWIVELLRPLLQRWLEQRHVEAFVGADQFVYWKQYDPHKRVAPDLYVLPGVSPTTYVRSWKTWETEIAPSFSLEVVSSDWEKDYSEAPPLYEAAGVQELVIFDRRRRVPRLGQHLGARSDAVPDPAGGPGCHACWHSPGARVTAPSPG